MARIAPPHLVNSAADLGALAGKNFQAKTTSGQEGSPPGYSRAMRALASKINAMLAHPRIHFSQCTPAADGYDNGNDASPLWTFRTNDYADNGRERRWSVLSLARTTAPGGGGSSLAHRNGDTADTTAITSRGTSVATSTNESDLALQQFIESRGNPTDSVDTQGIDADAGYRAYGLTVQDVRPSLLDSDVHQVCDDTKPAPGDPVIADRPEDLRAKLHHLRSECLPSIAWWSATTPLDGNEPGTSGYDGFVASSGTYTNIMDGSSTSRTATTPGVNVHCQHCNRENGGYSNNMVVKTEWYLLAEVDAGTGNVQFAGPRATATATVTATSPTWHGPYTLYLNGDKADSDATTSRNKVDILASVTTATDLWIYGWAGFTTYY